MSNNMVYSDIPSTRRTLPVPANTPSGAPLLIGDTPVVTLYGRGGETVTQNLAFGVSITRSASGVGVPDGYSTVATTGTYRFPVTGASITTVPGSAVYITGAGALTLTAGSNKRYGSVDFFLGERSATETAVKIGDVVANG